MFYWLFTDKITKIGPGSVLVQMALGIFLLHTKLHGPVTPTASPPMNRHLYPLILNDDRNNQLPQQSPGAPRRAGVVSAGPVPVSAGPAPPIIPPPARMRRDHHHCVPGCRQLVAVRPRANGVRWHRPAAQRIAPLRRRRAATGKSVISSVSALCFLNNSALTNNIFKAKSPLKQGGELW